MADNKDNKVTPKTNKLVQNIINNVSDGMNNLYKNTYLSTPLNNKDLNNIKNSFNKSLDKLLDTNLDNIGQASLSGLYSRVNGTTEGVLNDMLEDNRMIDGLMTDFMENKKYKEFDDEVDLILKFMPMLEDALTAKKDNVLSADNYSKDYVNVLNNENISNFVENIAFLKKNYDVINLIENAYDAASKYGEQFIYIDNYKDALFKLLKNKPDLKTGRKTVGEQVQIYGTDIMCESHNYKNLAENANVPLNNVDKDDNLYIEFSTCGVESAIMEQYITEKAKQKVQKISMTNSTDLSNVNFEGLGGSEGLIDREKPEGDMGKNNLDINGSIIKVLKRENVIGIYMDNMCLGYYYLECEFNTLVNDNGTHSFINMFSTTKKATSAELIQQQNQNRDKMLKSISAYLSEYIDKSFINSNKDLKEEIYVILNHNNNFNGANLRSVKVSFIPPEKMVHFKFKEDPDTHRGISDLEKALLPAKIYVYLYLNDTISSLRSQDKRIYNIKQQVDTNISQVLMNAIGQIKKGNMGARELTSMKTMLNITGRFNDIIVPVSQSGESPIDFQVMDGMRQDTPTDLMEMMQEMAINATDVPYEYVQSRKQVDFAIRLTMSSGKFLRTTFKRQAIVEILLSKMMTILYNNEFPEKNRKVDVQVTLPPPGFLQLLNNTQLFESVNTQTEMILNILYDDDTPQKKRKIMDNKLKKHYLKGYLDWDAIERLYDESAMEFARDTSAEDQQ